MNICVCVKQVPDTQRVKIDPEKGTLIRRGVPSIMNPFDESAIEFALEIKETVGGNVTVISMGIPSVENMLRYTYALGVDKAFLLTSPYFAGSDTLATSYILSRGIIKTGPFDLILFGKQAIDGDTGQVGPEVASILRYPLVTYVDDLIDVENNTIVIHRYTEQAEETVKVKLPSVLTVVKAKKRLRFPKLLNLIKSLDMSVIKFGPEDIQAEISKCGLKGSPTRVRKTYTPKLNRKTRLIDGSTREKAKKVADVIKSILSGV